MGRDENVLLEAVSFSGQGSRSQGWEAPPTIGPDDVAYCGRYDPQHDLLHCEWFSVDNEGGVDIPLAQIRAVVPAGLSKSFDDPMVQPMGAEHLVIAARRANWRESPGPEHNAIIVTLDGSLVTTACIGDGINRIATDSAGTLWVSYIDEGVFDANGWEQRGLDPVGVNGIARFGRQLSLEWRPTPVQVPYMADCYAINVAQHEVHACYYQNFPVIRIHDTKVRSWATQAAGVQALAVAGDNVALVGGYGGNRDRVIFGRLTNSGFAEYATKRLTLPNADPLPEWVELQGRGGKLHVFTEHDWYVAQLVTP